MFRIKKMTINLTAAKILNLQKFKYKISNIKQIKLLQQLKPAQNSKEEIVNCTVLDKLCSDLNYSFSINCKLFSPKISSPLQCCEMSPNPGQDSEFFCALHGQESSKP